MQAQVGGSKNRGPVAILTKDLLFAVSIRNTIVKLGFAPRIVKSPDALTDVMVAEMPVLAVVDLSTVGADGDWDAITDVTARDVPVLVFGPHKDVDGLRAAKAAGVTRVVSNGQFHREMGALIERYAAAPAVPEDDELDADDNASVATSGSVPPGIIGFAESSNPTD